MRTHPTTGPRQAISRPRLPGKATEIAGAAEAIALRLANRLSLDITRHSHTREIHVAHVNGAISMALSLGCLTEERAMQLRKACGQMMTGAALPTSNATAIEPGYARIIVAVRRNAGASINKPVELEDLGIVGARAVLDRLMADGIIAGPDMFGFHPLRAAEV